MIDIDPSRPPTVLLNLTGLRVAGGRSVAVNLLRAWRAEHLVDHLTVVGPPHIGYEAEVPAGARWIPLRGWRDRGWARPWVDAVTLPGVVREVRPDVVLTLSNMACRLPYGVHTAQALQVMWPYAMYDDDDIWRRLPFVQRLGKQLRRVYLRWAARRADVLIAQTAAARDRLLARLPVTRAVVIPTAVSLPRSGEPSEHTSPKEDAASTSTTGRTWLCLSRYYPHKNLETLVDVAEVLKRQGRSSKILLTIDPRQDPGAAAIMCDIETRDLSSHIRSIGEVDLDAVPGLYASAFGVVLPTLLESYSQVFVEALGFGVPLVTSDRDFVRSACGSAPVCVDPLSPTEIARAMARLEDDAELRDRHVREGLAWAAAQPSWHEVARSYADLCGSLRSKGEP